MNRLYQKTFDQVRMGSEQYRSLRESLASQCSRSEMEANHMKKTTVRRRPVVAAAILLVGALSVTAFAYGGRIVESVYQFMTGGTIEQGVDENGMNYSAGSMDTSGEATPVEVREDGSIWLGVNGEEIDITGQFSYTTPYIHDCIGEDGLRHVFVVGGDPDAIGWSEFVWDEDGMPAGGTSWYGTGGGREDAPWMDAAMETLGLPW